MFVLSPGAYDIESALALIEHNSMPGVICFLTASAYEIFTFSQTSYMNLHLCFPERGWSVSIREKMGIVFPSSPRQKRVYSPALS